MRLMDLIRRWYRSYDNNMMKTYYIDKYVGYTQDESTDDQIALRPCDVDVCDRCSICFNVVFLVPVVVVESIDL